jgi:RNA polymerase sigma factor (sigma-70 family)
MSASDGTLLERWIDRRDAEAFNEIVSRHAGLVYNVCRRIVRNDADAEDLAQDCFLKLAGVTYVPRSSLAGWLHTVAARTALDLRRAGLRRGSRERRFAEARARERPGAAAWSELQEEVDACIAELPPELREVVVAHFLERQTHEALAASLGVSRQTVTHRIARGVERLRLLLKKRGATATGAAVAALLGELPIQAAPPTLLASLGRLVLAGPPAGTVAASSSVLTTIANVGGFIVAKKLLVGALAALGLLLLAGFAAFRGIAERPPPVVSRPTPSRTAGDAPAGAAATTDRRRLAEERPGSTEAAVAREPLPGSLAGTVLGADGEPVAEARVLAVAGAPDRARKLEETLSDGAGKFRLDPAAAEDAVVWSFKRGAGLGSAPAGSAVEITLKPLGEVSGRFYDRATGEGIAGLPVRLAALESHGVAPEVASFYFQGAALFPELAAGSAGTTGQDGRYALEVLPVRLFFHFAPDASQYVLPGYRRHDSVPEILVASGERRTDVDFGLERGGSIAGRVFGPGDRALAGARVEVVSSYSSSRVLKCDGEGFYRFIGLAPDATYIVSAAVEGLSPGESPSIAMPGAEAIEEVDIHLVPGHVARGLLRDDLGRPAGGMNLALAKVADADRKIWIAGMTVAGDGSFSFAHVAAGNHVVRVFSQSPAIEEFFAFAMPEDRDLLDLEFVLRSKAPGFITGRVVDHLGNPVADFPLTAQSGGKLAARTRSGADGGFRLDGLEEAGTFVILAYSGEYWSQRQLSVPAYSTDVTVVVVQRGRIQGRVVDAETRAPIEHFETRAVFIRTEPGGGENRFHLKWTPFDSRTGEFLIERAEPVDCEVQVRAPGYVETRSSRFAIPPGGAAETMVVALNRGGSVEGVVVDAESGEPLAGALLRAHQHEAFFPWLLEEGKESYAPRGVWALTMSKADGAFAFGGLAPGETIHLVAWMDGYGPAIRAGIKVGQEGKALKLPLARAATLVIAARFRPQAGERYEFHALSREAQPWRAAFRAWGAAENPGTIEIPGLPPGPYRLAVCSVAGEGDGASRRLLGEERFEVAPGVRYPLSLDLDDLAKRFAAVSGKVTGEVDPRAVRLQVLDEDDPEEPYAFGRLTPSADGQFRFAGLPAGKYIILARSDGVEPPVEARVPVRVRDGQELEVDVPFK